MNKSKIVEQLTEWMINFVETPNDKLGDFPPCPYARQARINNKIQIDFATPDEFMSKVADSTKLLDIKDVVVICFDHNMISPVDLQEWVNTTNKDIMTDNYVILEDHPDAPEYVNGVKMNFGICGLLILQKLNKLNSAADQLREKGYYTQWDKQALNEVVNWRYK
jgi:hypothetical protein